MRAVRSAWPIAMACAMLSAIPFSSYGLMMTASPSSSAAPANSLRSSTPSSSAREAMYSLATRFMPSRSGVTSIASAAQ